MLYLFVDKKQVVFLKDFELGIDFKPEGRSFQRRAATFLSMLSPHFLLDLDIL